MDTRTNKLTTLAAVVLLAFALTTPSLAEAGKGRHGHGHGHGHHHRHQHHGHHHHHHDGYGYVYSQPRYYQPYYPQPRVNYYNVYPAPVYVPPPQLMMGIGTGNMDFMIRF